MTEAFSYERHVLRLPRLLSVVDEATKFFYGTPVCRLPPPRFIGCGVYALYYRGDFTRYAPLARLNRDACVRPVYVGKAVPRGRRKGRATDSETTELYSRLGEHRRSIGRGANLHIGDFHCRFMILAGTLTDLIVPVESELIRRHKPLWNTEIDGFGNHDPGSGRYDQAPSEWDVLHPGRPWVERLTGEPPRREDIIAKVQQALAPSLFA